MSRLLRKELIQAGAKPEEVPGLVHLAGRLSSLKEPIEKPAYLRTLLKPISLAATAMVLGMFLIVLSQSVQPSSWLYPVQEVSDNISVDIKPAYRENVMMKRAGQVNQLVASHASAKQILSTLNQYSTLAKAYKHSPHRHIR